MTVLSTTEEYILGQISEKLFGTSYAHPQSINWNDVIAEAKRQAVVSIVFSDMNTIPQEYRDTVRKLCIANSANTNRVQQNHCLAHSIMNKDGVDYVIFKGCASAYYYPELSLRTMGDVDFIVPKKDMDVAGQALIDNGFEAWQENHICHEVYRKGNTHLEMHFEPAGVPEGKNGELVRGYMEDVFETSFLYRDEMGEMRLPDAFHHGLVLLLHSYHHLTGEGIGLRQLCDWAVFAGSIENEEFKILFEDKLHAIGLWRFAQVLTQVCIRYLGMPRKDWALDVAVDEELLGDLMRDILDSGNFGCKDGSRAWETYMISDRGKSGVGGKTSLGQFVYNVNETIYLKVPASKKYKVMLPALWAYYGARQGVLAAQGKRRTFNPAEAAKGAEKRREIYRKLEIGEN